jgi:hypothetical protein
MSPSKSKTKSLFKQTVPKPDVEAVVHLLSELHKLLTEYAPRWYTEDMHARLNETLARFRPPKAKRGAVA